jgi:hypothetical protein
MINDQNRDGDADDDDDTSTSKSDFKRLIVAELSTGMNCAQVLSKKGRIS